MNERTITVILAGGAGSRLNPLTADRAKPAVPFGGRYRIIDFALSNCLHSGLRRILVLTQYKSHSLQQHLGDCWSIFNSELQEYVTVVPPQMRTGESWYAGTADAIYQNLYLLERSGADLVLVLSGDHVYRMDYSAMLRHHCNCDADVTIVCMEASLHEARAFGVMGVDGDECVVSFHEKPEHPPAMPENPAAALVSMGVYAFSFPLLRDLLVQSAASGRPADDFGRDVLPRVIRSHRVVAYRFGGSSGRVTQDRYWRDVGTIDAYYESNMDLLLPAPPIDLYQGDWYIRSYEGQHPPARTVPGRSGREAVIVNSMLASGTVVSGGTVQHSILFPRARVEEGAAVEECLLFHDVTVGPGAQMRRCIVDKYVRIPSGVKIGYDPAADARRFVVSDKGIVVVPKGYRFESGRPGM